MRACVRDVIKSPIVMLLFSLYQNKNFDKVLRTLSNIPPTEEMMRLSRCDLKKLLDQRNAKAYPLLQW